MSNHDQVLDRLGEDAVKKILDFTRGGKLSRQNVKDFAFHLGRPADPNVVYGKHLHRTEGGSGEAGLDVEVRKILSDWWNEKLHEMTTVAALEKLVRIFLSDDVSCKPLAQDIQKLLDRARYICSS